MYADFGRYLFIAAAAIFLLEVLAGRHRGIYRKEDLLVTALCELVKSAATRPFAAFLISSLFAFALPQYRGALADLPLLPSFVVILIVCDVAFYWVHRWAHQAKGSRHDWLWKLHRTHHAGKYMNVTVTARINVFWILVVPTSWLLGLAAYLGLGKAAALVIFTIFVWNLLTHSHFRWDDCLRRHRLTRTPMAVFEHLIVTPGIHHTHHGYGADGKNYRNFAVVFSWLDWMFGTLHIPQGRPAYYGLPGKNPHWAEEVFYPLIRIKPKAPPSAPHHASTRRQN